MRIIELHIDKYYSRVELLKALHSANLVAGDVVKIIAENNDEVQLKGEATILFSLLSLVSVLREQAKRKATEKALTTFVDQQLTRASLLKLLNEEFGVRIEFEINTGDGIVDPQNAPLLEPNALYRRSNQYN